MRAANRQCKMSVPQDGLADWHFGVITGAPIQFPISPCVHKATTQCTDWLRGHLLSTVLLHYSSTNDHSELLSISPELDVPGTAHTGLLTCRAPTIPPLPPSPFILTLSVLILAFVRLRLFSCASGWSVCRGHPDARHHSNPTLTLQVSPNS